MLRTIRIRTALGMCSAMGERKTSLRDISELLLVSLNGWTCNSGVYLLYFLLFLPL